MGGGDSKENDANQEESFITKDVKRMSKEDASRIQSSGAKNPTGQTHESGFDRRAQSAADKNENKQKD